MTWTHDALALDLAGYLRGNSERFVWTDMQLGPMHAPRPDVYTLPMTYARWVPLAYECKVSRSDFRADITAGKWQDYLQFAGAVIFAVPAGLIDKSEVPPGCGLMQRTEKQWRTMQRPTLRNITNLPRDAWMKILLDGLHRAHPTINTRRGELVSSYLNNAAIRKKFGAAISALLSKRENVERDFEYDTMRLEAAADDAKIEYDKIITKARERAESDSQQVQTVKNELCIMLGLPPDSSVHAIHRQAQQQFAALIRDEEINRLTNILSTVKYALENILVKCPNVAKNDSPLESESFSE